MTFKLEERWAELLTLVFIVLGFVLSLALRQAVFSYISIILAGFMAGIIFFIKHYQEPLFPFILIILGFLVGYLLGSFWANRFAIFILFLGFFALSYYLHLKKIFVIFKSQQFVK